MEFEINDSPELTMAEITKKLFNCNFLSDVQFRVANQTIYGHSLELMKRSTVFRKQLEITLGEKKLIPISDVPYDSAYQFFRFIYTDECDVNNTNVIGIFKLSKRYKVIKLENHLFHYITDADSKIAMYEYCLLENDQHHIRRSKESVNFTLNECLSSNQLLKAHPIVMENILKFDRVNLSEVQLFEGLSRWITHHSRDNQIEISQQKTCYDKYLRLIRFPVMTADEVLKCTTTHPQLFNDNNYVSSFKSLSLNSGNDLGLWNNQRRTPYSYPYAYKYYSNDENFETKFGVSRGMVLNVLRIGCENNIGIDEIIFSQSKYSHQITKSLKLEDKSFKGFGSRVLNLGESIRLQPNIEYAIQIKYKMRNPLQVLTRDDNTDVFINLTPDLIIFKTVSGNMIEMHFTLDTL